MTPPFRTTPLSTTAAWLEYGWACLDCPEHGDGEGSDKVAEKHTKKERHSTHSWSKPKEV